MSGIAAAFNRRNGWAVERMLEKIRHRGPEAEEIYSRGSVQLGEASFAREELDPVSQEGYGVVLDGEPSLEGRPLSKGELLRLYLQYGSEFVKELEGKFSLILSDGHSFFATRDLFGIKPLYYARAGKELYLASEMKALVTMDDPGEIEVFPPGHCLTGEGEVKRYKELPLLEPCYRLEVEEAGEKLRELVFFAVKKALHKGNKTGIFLSGGVDSSILAAAAKEVSEGKCFTFVAGLEGSPDVANAGVMAGEIGSEHKEYIYHPREMFEVLREVIYYLESFDVELINSSIANYFVSKLAHQGEARIILSGEGADELFGGYHFLKQYRNDRKKFARELNNLMQGLHNSGFQRVDRMAKSHSLEVEMPFMDGDIVQFALNIPPEWKISEDEMGKWLLRKAFESFVPEEIIWRRKEQFGVGSGTENIMQELIEKRVSDEEFLEADAREESIDFKSKEEYYYYKIFREFYPAKSAVKTVNRWLV